jgi:hypothetical protein
MKTLLRIIAMVVLTFLMLSLTKCSYEKENKSAPKQKTPIVALTDKVLVEDIV